MNKRNQYYQENLFRMLDNKLPYKVGWQITGKCNLKCKQCYADAREEKFENELSNTEAKKLISDLIEMGAISMVFTGGEPLIREDVFDLITFATRRGMDIKVATNATLLTPLLADKLKDAGVKTVHVSIDGSSSDVHDKIRGVKNAFTLTLNGIAELKRVGITVVVGVTIMRHNLKDIIPIMDLCVDIKADVFTFNDMEPCGRGKRELGKEDISAEERENIYQLIFKKWQEIKNKIYVDKFDPSMWLRIHKEHAQSSEDKQRIIDFAEKLGGCPAGRWVCLVDPNGNVRPCAFLPIIAGNIRDEGGIKKIWQSSSLFTSLRNESLIHGPCKKCEHFSICRGCRSRAYHYTGDYHNSDPGCILSGKDFYQLYK
jgi:AdoMet-dependent heme synthase